MQPPAASNRPPPRLALLACSVFEREIALHAGQPSLIRETGFFEIGLHDQPDTLRAALQEGIDSLDARDDLDAIVLAYGLCGLGTAGLKAGRHPLVIPRAHDCITVFLGGVDRHAAQQGRCPTCHYYTPGWNRGRRVPGPERLEALRAELRQRFDEEDVEFLLETEREQWRLRDTAIFLDLGTDDAEREAAYARRCADWLGWRFERLKGDPTLLQDLLRGRWEDASRFQIISPGCRLAHSPDSRVMRCEAADK